MDHPWTEDRLDRLKKAWLNGDSASQIAKALGAGITRGAVCGKVHRLGLSRSPRREPENPNRGAAQPCPGRPSPPPRRGPAMPDGPTIAPPPTLVAPPPVSERRDVVRMAGTCAWPVGDPRSAAFSFCGEVVVRGRQYCGEHCRKAGISAAPKPMLVMGRVARPYRFGHADR